MVVIIGDVIMKLHASLSEHLHAAQAKSAIAYPSEHLTMENAVVWLEKKFELEILLQREAGVTRTCGPRSCYQIITSATPFFHLITKEPCINMALSFL